MTKDRMITGEWSIAGGLDSEAGEGSFVLMPHSDGTTWSLFTDGSYAPWVPSGVELPGRD